MSACYYFEGGDRAGYGFFFEALLGHKGAFQLRDARESGRSW